MTAFEDRERAYEEKFAHDEKMQFKARARRDRLFGEWLAGQIGIKADDVADYAKSVVLADLEEDGDDDVLRKAETDLKDAGVELSRHRLEKQLAEFYVTAKQQILSEV